LTRFSLGGVSVSTLTWSPDATRLAIGAYSQTWIVGRDGRGLHRLVRGGASNIAGWTGRAPVRPEARPLPRTEVVGGLHTLTVRGSIYDIAADGGRVAFVADSAIDCHHVAVWTPSTKSLRRFEEQGPCFDLSNRDGLGGLGFAGTRAAWVATAGGNTLEQYVLTRTLAQPEIAEVASAFALGDSDYGTFIDDVVGAGSILAFSVEHVCSEYQSGTDACPPGRKTGDVVAATVYRIAANGCTSSAAQGRARACAVAKSNGLMQVLAVDAGRIAVRTETGVRLLGTDGRVVRDFAAVGRVAALSGKRLAVRTNDAVEIYDTDSGQLTLRLPVQAGVRLEDLEANVLVTASGGAVTLQNLANGRMTTIRAGGVARAQLEPPGLFVAGYRRLTFTPMRDVLRRLVG